MASPHPTQHSMSEAQFLTQSQATLDALERALEALIANGHDDLELDRHANVLTLDLPDGAQIVINSHASAQEIWVAARAGGFHCAWQAGRWIDRRTNQELFALLSALLQSHTGVGVVLVPSPS
jgi:CyaY protein